MQSNYPYLKALIIFPLIMQILGTIIAVCISDNTDEMFGVVDLVLFHMYVTFFCRYHSGISDCIVGKKHIVTFVTMYLPLF